jgi:hypothetical protein
MKLHNLSKLLFDSEICLVDDSFYQTLYSSLCKSVRILVSQSIIDEACFAIFDSIKIQKFHLE